MPSTNLLNRAIVRFLLGTVMSANIIYSFVFAEF